MRLIDADALVERTQELEDFFVTSWTTEKVQRLIHEAPTVEGWCRRWTKDHTFDEMEEKEE